MHKSKVSSLLIVQWWLRAPRPRASVSVLCKLWVTNSSYIIVSHTEVGNVTNIEECDFDWGLEESDFHQDVRLTLRSVTNIGECETNIE